MLLGTMFYISQLEHSAQVLYPNSKQKLTVLVSKKKEIISHWSTLYVWKMTLSIQITLKSFHSYLEKILFNTQAIRI